MTVRNSLAIPLFVSLAVHLAVIGVAEIAGDRFGSEEQPYRVEYQSVEPATEEPRAKTEDEQADPMEKAISLETADPRYAPYLQKVRRRIAENWKEPAGATGEPEVGSVMVEFSLDRQGLLVAVSVARSSGGRSLDRAAASAVKDAAPYDPFSPEMEEENITVRALFLYE